MSDPVIERVHSTLTGTVIKALEPGTVVAAGSIVAIVESMKMEYPFSSTNGGTVRSAVTIGASVKAGDALCEIDPSAADAHSVNDDVAGEPTVDRLTELREREALLADDARADRVARRRERGLRTALENVTDLVDPGSFTEFGRFAFAAQTRRREVDDLIAATPRDGLITGFATVNAELVGVDRAHCAVLSYDYMVLAGTQGQRNHRKKDRLFELIDRVRTPVVFFTEGGGGRPGDTDTPTITGLDTEAFQLFARLRGRVPMIGIAAGYCFAGNAALLGCCDLIIACEGASIGMGGPAMIEGGGLGVVPPELVGPVTTHVAAGSVDLVARDEAHAVVLTKRLLSYAQGPLSSWRAPDQTALRSILPQDRRRTYDPRDICAVLFDEGSFLEVRPNFATGMITAFARLEGHAVAVVANSPAHLAGAIDADGATKAARHLDLAQSWGLPVVTLVDTPGFMVGPEAEATGLVRHASELFVSGAALTVPLVSVITRRGYGLGAQAMCGGSFVAPLLTLAWPQAELGGMGLEGAVRLGFRRQLDAIEDPDERERTLQLLIDRAYENGRALNVAAHLELDDVIDPAVTRERLIAALAVARANRRDQA